MADNISINLNSFFKQRITDLTSTLASSLAAKPLQMWQSTPYATRDVFAVELRRIFNAITAAMEREENSIEAGILSDLRQRKILTSLGYKMQQDGFEWRISWDG